MTEDVKRHAHVRVVHLLVLSVPRHDHHDAMTSRRERLGQRLHDAAQTARLTERRALARHHDDVQTLSTLPHLDLGPLSLSASLASASLASASLALSFRARARSPRLSPPPPLPPASPHPHPPLVRVVVAPNVPSTRARAPRAPSTAAEAPPTARDGRRRPPLLRSPSIRALARATTPRDDDDDDDDAPARSLERATREPVANDVISIA